MMSRKSKLRKLLVNRVDLVDRGANQHAHIPLFKRDETLTEDGQPTTIAPISSERLERHDDRIRKERDMATDTVSIEMSEDVALYIEDLQATIAKQATELESLSETPAPEGDALDDVMKSLPDDTREDIQKAVAKATERADAAEAELAVEKMAKRQTEFVAKAAALPHIFDNGEDGGDLLRKLADADPEAYEGLEAHLVTVNKRVETAGLFAEAGSGAEGRSEGTITGKVESLAKAAREADPSLSLEGARAKVWVDNPELYQEYRDNK